MFNLPVSTEVGKKIPKTKFYQHLSLSSKEKQIFIDEIEMIVWHHKLSPDTIPISSGEQVKEIQVFEIQLKQKQFNPIILRLIDRAVPYHILYLLTWNDEGILAIGYKERKGKADEYGRVNQYYYTEWMAQDSINPDFSGLSLDTIYEGLVRQILPDEQPQLRNLKDTIHLQIEIEKQKRICDALLRKVKNEKQFNIQILLNQDLRKERDRLDSLLAGLDP